MTLPTPDRDFSPSPSLLATPTLVFLQRQLWIGPLIAAAVLGIIGYWVRDSVNHAVDAQLRNELLTLLHADVEGLKIWLKLQKLNAESAADSEDIKQICQDLIADSRLPGDLVAQLSNSSASRRLADEMKPWLDDSSYQGYILVDQEQRILGSHAFELLGRQKLPGYSDFLTKALAGDSVVSHPFPSLILLTDEGSGHTSVGVPTMYAAAPIRDADNKIIGALGLRLRPEDDFTRILDIARGGQSGETYAFNRAGRMLSESRFEDKLKKILLLPDLPDAKSILQLELKDPGGDLTEGYRPTTNRSEWKLTYPVANAIQGHTGANADGHRDYRGVPSICAWTWLEDYDFGVVTEMDLAEAQKPMQIVRTVFWSLFSLITVTSLVIFVFTVVVSKLQQSARHAALKAQQLGQYHLDTVIGQGAMGIVYRGHHALLRRPTAIKLLNVERTTPKSIARFEREVRLTSQLSHPNTISIYDFGRTPEGIFYYAMELLDGMNLEALVHGWGPQTEGRIIHLLTQLCGSLNEAHAQGLIHRDVKPANIMLCQLGGMFDVIKLLDFGLVKAADAEREAGLTAANAVMGTPLYMSPESITNPDQVDARSDLYSLGAVGYYLLTGTAVFTGPTINDILRRHIDVVPQTPSDRLGRAVDPVLETCIMRCLSKSPADRPGSALELADLLEQSAASHSWSSLEARTWWANRVPHETLDADPSAATKISGPLTPQDGQKITTVLK
ncbi:MAG: serine/threonine protein kinase [Planctomycetes bacterium]|nr:serine/threonine protein kinase [Planctomycetota bacterium]